MNHLADSFDFFISVQTLCVSVLIFWYQFGCDGAASVGTAPARLPGSVPMGSDVQSLAGSSCGLAKALLSCAFFFFSMEAFCLTALVAEAFPLLGSIKCSPGTLSARILSFSG